MKRPTYIDLPKDDASRAPSAAGTARIGLLSPRIRHFDGDIPPTLSPLDAFAAHSMRLAKELEETRRAGERRMSRLPPQVVTKSLTQHQANRPQCFRSLSGNKDDIVPPLPRPTVGLASNNPEVAHPTVRPKSSYPHLDRILDVTREQLANITLGDDVFVQNLHQTSRPRDYFGASQADSPLALEPRDLPSFDIQDSQDHEVVGHQKAATSQPDLTYTLAPPNAAFTRMRQYHESSDDDYTSSNTGSTFSQTRKLSSSSGMSLPRTPASPYVPVHQRSPSLASNSSALSQQRSLSHLNFSRPRSTASLNSYAQTNSPSRSHSRQLSKGSQASRQLDSPKDSFDDARSHLSEGFVSAETSSYTHAKFDLPRGRMADRTSAVFLGLSTPHFEWQEPLFVKTPPLGAKKDGDLPEPSPRPSREEVVAAQTERTGFSFEFETESNAIAGEHSDSSTSKTAEESVQPAPSNVQLSNPHTPQDAPSIPPMPTFGSDVVSSRSNSTIRPTTVRNVSNYQSLSADEHVTKAIELHQHGDLKESTYHLRIAAKQDHPTGMLLYALACRHGWGLRPNPKEAVLYLRKAVDLAMLEVADDENPPNYKREANPGEKKTHRAQFALSIYELGVSHLNGWGVEQDKALALRCFEIAGQWGDTDALTEAGFCYAEGIGCKKDMKKAARFYRTAEARGVSMVGNSW